MRIDLDRVSTETLKAELARREAATKPRRAGHPDRTVTRAMADAIAEQTKDAYSFTFFGMEEWSKMARRMALRGFTVREIEAVLRSKWTRWCRENEVSTSNELFKMLDKHPDSYGQPALDQLVAGTFGGN